MVVRKIIQKIGLHPKLLFLVDGFGAMLSAFMLGVVLARLEPVFGIPASVLYLLAAIPPFFVLFDFYAYRKEERRLVPYLKGIAIMNTAYCCLSIGLAMFYKHEVTFWGWAYLFAEAAIIAVLVYLELQMAKKLAMKYRGGI